MRAKTLFGLVVLMIGLTGAAQAAPILDQNNASTNQVGYCTGQSGCTWYQTVITGVAGTLAGVDVWASGGGISIYGGTNGGSLGPLLFSGSLASGLSYGTSQYVDTSAAGIVNAVGQTFVLAISSYDYLSGNVAQYGGAHNLWLKWPYSNGNQPFDYNQFSLGFRSYVESVPAPGALALLVVGLAGFGAARRRKAAA